MLLNSLRLKRQEEKEDFLKIPLLSIKDTLIDVTQKKMTVGSFSTEKGRLILNRFKNGELDLQKLFPPSPPKKEPAKRKERGENHGLSHSGRWPSINIRSGWRIRTFPTHDPYGEKIALRGENISTAKNASGKLSLSFLLDQPGPISTRNTISIDPLKIGGLSRSSDSFK